MPSAAEFRRRLEEIRDGVVPAAPAGGTQTAEQSRARRENRNQPRRRTRPPGPHVRSFACRSGAPARREPRRRPRQRCSARRSEIRLREMRPYDSLRLALLFLLRRGGEFRAPRRARRRLSRSRGRDRAPLGAARESDEGARSAPHGAPVVSSHARRAPSDPDAGADLRGRFRGSQSDLVPEPDRRWNRFGSQSRPTRHAPTRPLLTCQRPRQSPERRPAPTLRPTSEFRAARLDAFRAALDAGG